MQTLYLTNKITKKKDVQVTSDKIQVNKMLKWWAAVEKNINAMQEAKL